MLRKAFATIVMSTLMFALGGAATGSATAVNHCSSEQGQLFID